MDLVAGRMRGVHLVDAFGNPKKENGMLARRYVEAWMTVGSDILSVLVPKSLRPIPVSEFKPSMILRASFLYGSVPCSLHGLSQMSKDSSRVLERGMESLNASLITFAVFFPSPGGVHVLFQLRGVGIYVYLFLRGTDSPVRGVGESFLSCAVFKQNLCLVFSVFCFQSRSKTSVRSCT